VDVDLKIVARGPLAELGTLSLSEASRLLGEFQQTLERLALQLQGGKLSTGRRPAEISEAVRLEFKGIERGCAVLTISEPSGALLNDTLDQTFRLLSEGAAAIANGGDELPAEFDSPVLDGLLRLSGGIAPGRLNSITVTLGDKELMAIDAEFRSITRRLTRLRTTREATVVGLLQMTDFAPSALRCRIDTLTDNIVCEFDESQKDEVLDLVDQLVIAQGSGRFTKTGDRLLSLDLNSVTLLANPSHNDVSTLATEQGVAPWGEDEVFLFEGEPLTEEEFEAFFESAMSARQRDEL